jgi:hypothetical protein
VRCGWLDGGPIAQCGFRWCEQTSRESAACTEERIGCGGAAMVVESPESVMKEENCEVEEEKSQLLYKVRAARRTEKRALASLAGTTSLHVYSATGSRWNDAFWW